MKRYFKVTYADGGIGMFLSHNDMSIESLQKLYESISCKTEEITEEEYLSENVELFK